MTARWTTWDTIGSGIIGAAAILGVTGGLWVTLDQAFPPEHWYEFRSMDVLDTLVGQPVQVVLDREVHRSFRGDRLNTVRNSRGEAICSGEYPLDYRVGEVLPNPVLLSWWTENTSPPCAKAAADPGEYSLTSCVRIEHRVPFLPPRETCLSDVFRIVGREPAP